MEFSSIKDAFGRVAKKQKLSVSKSQKVIELINQHMGHALSGMQSAENGASSTDHKSVLDELKAKLKEVAPQLEGTEKELNVALAKYLKLLEKALIPDISKAYRTMDNDINTVNQIIASHFYHEGLFDLGDCFVNESNETEAAAIKPHFLEMHRILEAMESGNLEPSLKWAMDNHEKLKQIGSDIAFKLHQLQYLGIIQNKGREEGLKYAKTSLSPFASSHFSEFQKLMACLLWAKKTRFITIFGFLVLCAQGEIDGGIQTSVLQSYRAILQESFNCYSFSWSSGPADPSEVDECDDCEKAGVAIHETTTGSSGFGSRISIPFCICVSSEP